MIKRVIEISHARTHLSIQYDQLIVKQEGLEKARIPAEDIGILLVDHPATTYTHSVFTRLVEFGATVIVCGPDHHPAALFLPLAANTTQTESFRFQIAAKEPLKKQLWKQIVRAKIAHQARIVRDNENVSAGLRALIPQVRSGDPDNVEARAAKLFWSAFLEGLRFRRDREGPAPNNLLNYGYMTLRAAVARAICSAGLLPALGVHHCNRYNAFCLADDLVEPFRGFVESRVRLVIAESGGLEALDELTQPIKARLLEILYIPVTIGEFEGPLMVSLHRTAASLVRCFAGEQKSIDLPRLSG
jgi:CRISPR-associated protein Cas1